MIIAIPDLNTIHQGDSLSVLRSWPDEFVQCVVTSPPYWGLRDYGVEGQFGLEPTPNLYVERMVEVFREVRRVLKEDGTLWLNLGDSYAGSWGAQSRGDDYPGTLQHPGPTISARQIKAAPKETMTGSLKNTPGLKPKDLCGIPWRVALALQSDGWYLRSDIIWSKPNPMPESVTDRPTKAHEYIFLMSKSERYFYDADAIRDPHVRIWNGTNGGSFKPPCEKNLRFSEARKKKIGQAGAHVGAYPIPNPKGANKRSVWTIGTAFFAEAHFATFPEDIPSICIRAGSRPGDVVLDPFMGSGTTAVVAKRLKRSWLGIELNPAYIEIAGRRIGKEEEPLCVEGAA